MFDFFAVEAGGEGDEGGGGGRIDRQASLLTFPLFPTIQYVLLYIIVLLPGILYQVNDFKVLLCSALIRGEHLQLVRQH